jgi:hypothetical protein
MDRRQRSKLEVWLKFWGLSVTGLSSMYSCIKNCNASVSLDHNLPLEIVYSAVNDHDEIEIGR